MKLNAKEISELNAERAGHQARIQEIDTLLMKHTSIIAQENAQDVVHLYKLATFAAHTGGSAQIESLCKTTELSAPFK